MKKLLVLSMIAAFSVPALADAGRSSSGTRAESESASVSSSSSGSSSYTGPSSAQAAAETGDSSAGFVINSPLSVSVTPEEQTIRYDGSYTVKNAPSMGAPNITSSNDTCMGSASGAVSGPGFGVAVGSTFTDENCIMLKNSRELWNMGMRAAALAHMCSDPKVAKSLEVTGYKCPARGDQPAAGSSQGAPAPVTDRDWNSMYHGG